MYQQEDKMHPHGSSWSLSVFLSPSIFRGYSFQNWRLFPLWNNVLPQKCYVQISHIFSSLSFVCVYGCGGFKKTPNVTTKWFNFSILSHKKDASLSYTHTYPQSDSVCTSPSLKHAHSDVTNGDDDVLLLFSFGDLELKKKKKTKTEQNKELQITFGKH